MRRTLAVLFVSLLAVWASLLVTSRATAQDADPPPAAPRGPSETPAKVVVGVYIDRIRDVSLRENRFSVSFYVWFRWTDASLDPLKSFDVTNGSVTSRSGEVREDLKDFHYASCRCEADITQFFDVSRYPFDDHVLTIEIEDTEKEAEFVQYVCDSENSSVAPNVQVPGWGLGEATCGVDTHLYTTNYGNVDLPKGNASEYSRYLFSLPVNRTGIGYFAKLFFGLFIAVGIALLTFHLKPTDLDPRFGLPVGAIFAAVGSLYVTSAELPNTNVITLSDRMHILAFGVIFVALVESTVTLHIWYAGKEDLSKKLDKVSFWTLATVFVVGSFAAVMLS